MSPESECIGCGSRFYGIAWSKIKPQELTHHQNSAVSANKGESVLHECSGFCRYDDYGRIVGWGNYAHGRIYEEKLSADDD